MQFFCSKFVTDSAKVINPPPNLIISPRIRVALLVTPSQGRLPSSWLNPRGLSCSFHCHCFPGQATLLPRHSLIIINFFNPEPIRLVLIILRNIFAIFQLTKPTKSFCDFETPSEYHSLNYSTIYTLLSVIVYSFEVISHSVKLHMGKKLP